MLDSRLINKNFTESEKLDIQKKSIVINNIINNLLSKREYVQALRYLHELTNCIDIREYLLLDSAPKVSKEIMIDSLFNYGTILKMICEETVNNKINELKKNDSNKSIITNTKLSDDEQELIDKSLQLFITILQIDFENIKAIEQITSIYSYLTYLSQSDYNLALNYLTQALLFAPTNPSIHYNLGHMYQKLNTLTTSLVHYKISLQLNQESKDCKLALNNLNGIASIYRGIKKWPESLYYLLKAHKLDPTDPDINNQLGVVYTEMRRTDLGEQHYLLAIQHYQKTFISTDSKFFLSEIYLNLGHLYSYNGNNEKSIECYNKALINTPKFVLPFQNKIFNLTYCFDELQDKMYIRDQHVLVNKLYKKYKYTFTKEFYQSEKINIGIISADFIDHPVSFFISTFLKKFDNTKFNVICYSECLIDTSLFNKNIQFKFIKNMSQKNAADLIYNDNIHILLDLAGHTGFNRLDIFAFKPSPIQISYIGYPFTTGLYEMDYRITDNICDKPEISQKFYTEKLLYLDNCFTCYDPDLVSRNGENFKLPDILKTPKNDYLTIACFNRLNKINDAVIKQFNEILMKCHQVKFMFKTKALINKNIKQDFLQKFDKKVIDRIIILDCTLTHLQHLETYNQADIAIDTFPYSGTTTSCEALVMGLPVFSVYDTTHYFHPQNVTVSILKNSNLDFYICNNTNEIIEKINILQQKEPSFWKTNKENIRKQFLQGKVCNQTIYMENIQKMLVDLYKEHKNTFLQSFKLP
jgi:protein O-GlcNAc transferase